MSETISILPSSLTSTDDTVVDKAMVLGTLPDDIYKFFQAAITVEDVIPASTLSAVKVYYKVNGSGNIYLKFDIHHTDVSSPPATPTTATGTLAAYAASGTAGQINVVNVPAALLTSFTSIEENDTLAIAVERDATNVLDTYEYAFDIVRIDFILSETATATDYDIVTLATAKEYLGISNSDTTMDTALQRWISYISLWVENYCQRKFKVQDILNEVHNGTGNRFIYPFHTPIYGFYTTATPSDDFVYKDDPTDASWTEIEATDAYIFFDPHYPYRFELYQEAFPSGRQNVKISYKAGFSPIPGDVCMVVLEMIQMTYNESKTGKDWLRIASKSRNEAGVNFNQAIKNMKQEWYDTLNRYRNFA